MVELHPPCTNLQTPSSRISFEILRHSVVSQCSTQAEANIWTLQTPNSGWAVQCTPTLAQQAQCNSSHSLSHNSWLTASLDSSPLQAGVVVPLPQAQSQAPQGWNMAPWAVVISWHSLRTLVWQSCHKQLGDCGVVLHPVTFMWQLLTKLQLGPSHGTYHCHFHAAPKILGTLVPCSNSDAIKPQPCHLCHSCHIADIWTFWIMELIRSQPCLSFIV